MLFLPDQHLGRNTAVLEMGLSLDDCVVYNPHRPNGGLTARAARNAKMILWQRPLLGARPVHRRVAWTTYARRIPGVNVLVHPECRHEVVTKADYVGSTEYIIKTLAGGARRVVAGRSAPS